MPAIQIFGMPQSNYVCTARLACGEKGVAHELVVARPHSPEIDAIHPAGLMPVMRHGDVTLFETKAICGYVDRLFSGRSLQPLDPLGFAQVEQWVSFINTSFYPVAISQYALSYFFNRSPDGSPNRPLIDAALPRLEKFIGAFDQAVAKTGHLVGRDVTLADMFLLPMMFYLLKLPESAEMIAKARALTGWCDTHLARKSFIAVAPPPMPGNA